MKYNRCAYTILEMLAVIAAIVVLMALTIKPMRTLVLDIPRANRDYQTWTQTQDMLKQLKKDVESAAQISVNKSGSSPGRLLSLRLAGEHVSYSLTDNSVIRETGASQETWELPHVKINWQVWENDRSPYAIEITTWTEHILSDKVRKKYEQSFVYFQKKGS